MPLHLEIVTPERQVFSDTVDSVQVPGGKLPMRLPTSVNGVALLRFAFPLGTAREVWLQRGLPSSQ